MPLPTRPEPPVTKIIFEGVVESAPTSQMLVCDILKMEENDVLDIVGRYMPERLRTKDCFQFFLHTNEKLTAVYTSQNNAFKSLAVI